MASLWPWLAVAGLGALHGLNPATGWLLAAVHGVRAGNSTQVLRALVPIAAGHAASVLLVAAGVAVSVNAGWVVEAPVLYGVAACVLVVALLAHLRHRAPAHAARRTGGKAGLALAAFAMATWHGTGWMLVPVLVPLCLFDGAVREITAGGSLALALAAVAVHMAAMLVVTGGIAMGVCRVFDRARPAGSPSASARTTPPAR